ncbi:hypothetical protein GCWU000282_01878 [Catonella morbi ATCC 51271]|uniref:Uncharacterized protein n=1 Tax=Catonella morbi ATCC 51271 TaxID=592026 RepID=V2Z7U6_9FIRM|nr:hypothetical protein GCWU000282_01878 [Catonella morbi ATCC 51271]
MSEIRLFLQGHAEVKPKQSCIIGVVALRIRYTKYSDNLMINLLYRVALLLVASTLHHNIIRYKC